MVLEIEYVCEYSSLLVLFKIGMTNQLEYISKEPADVDQR